MVQIDYFIKKYAAALKCLGAGVAVEDSDIGPATEAIRKELERLRRDLAVSEESRIETGEQLISMTIDRDRWRAIARAKQYGNQVNDAP